MVAANADPHQQTTVEAHRDDSDPKKENPKKKFKPEDLDPSFWDPNANPKHRQTLDAIAEAYANLPPGWSRNDDRTVAGGAPFVHVDGRTSWKNPARDNIDRVLEEALREDPAAWWGGNAGPDQKRRASIKKLRRMVKFGTPMVAVENQARLEGVDMEEVLGETGSSDDEASEDGGGRKRREGGRSGSPPSTASWAEQRRKRTHDGEVAKVRKMSSLGAPRSLVEARARAAGIDPSVVFEDGVSPTDVVTDTDMNEKKDGEYGQLFRLVAGKDGAKVEVDSGSDLASLVRRMVQTVHRGGGSSATLVDSSNRNRLTVELRDLYNALNAFRGVRLARDAYNGADASAASSSSEAKSKRRPFLEHLSAIGVRPPPVVVEGGERVLADIAGLDGLIDLIERECRDDIASARDGIGVGTYDFASLTEVYPPGRRVVARNAFAAGVDAMCEVSWSRYEEGRTLFGVARYFRVCFQFVVAVGEHFVTAEFVEGMESFDGKRDVRSLQFVPVDALGDEKEVLRTVEAYRKRGEMYDRCATGSHFLAYGKGSFYAKGGGGASTGKGNATAALRTDGRIMVDISGSYEAGYSVSVGYDPMVDAIKMKYKEYMLHMRRLRQASSSGGGESAGSATEADVGMVLFETVPDEYLELTWPAAVGFSFTSKAWGDVLIDGLSDIHFDESTFDKLVLPPAKKRMIKALVRHSADAFNDIVSGKGEGSVFLLYGPPGVGKTLTAEAISEMLHKPLYTVSLGQLGTTPTELETKLGEILDLCARWDALILLDEADIFLEKRTAGGSLERNAMVSVMLRLVEYFRGVLFLTSNRVDSLDPAFKTRITLALRYTELDAEARGRVWMNLLLASGHCSTIEAGTIDLSVLAGWKLNGREIKNCIRLAMALAAEDGKELSQDIILETVEMFCDFNAKLNSAEKY